MRSVVIYVLFCNGAFRDVFASYSEATRESHGSCCSIERRNRQEYAR